jgi:hypothetical protein
MSNIYISISLICLIILNCLLFTYETGPKEGFNIKKALRTVQKFNPAKMIDEALGKLIDTILGSIPIMKDIHKKVKKEKGLIKKIKTTFFELFISLMTIIFQPLAAMLVFTLAYYVGAFFVSSLYLLFQRWQSLANM